MFFSVTELCWNVCWLCHIGIVSQNNAKKKEALFLILARCSAFFGAAIGISEEQAKERVITFEFWTAFSLLNNWF